MNDVVYKVVHRVGKSQFYSVCHDFSSALRNLSLEYHLDKIIRPEIEGSGIYAFDTLINALLFAEPMRVVRNVAILSCEYERLNMPAKRSYYSGKQNIIRWWKDRNSYHDMKSLDAPQGTVLCMWVKPILIVENLDRIC